MKSLALILVALAGLGGACFGIDEQGAIGFGITGQSGQNQPISTNLRIHGFLDAGSRLAGPFSYGFELAADVSKLTEKDFTITENDVYRYGLGSDALLLYGSSYFQQTYTLWDLDISPRVYLSYDLRKFLQLLGFVGLNLDWQSLSYTATYIGSSSLDISTSSSTYTIEPGQSITTSPYLSATLYGTRGLRASIEFLYIGYTHLVNLTKTNLDVGNTGLDRIDAGVSARF